MWTTLFENLSFFSGEAREGIFGHNKQYLILMQLGMKIIKHWAKFRKYFCEHVCKSNGSKLHCCIEWSKFKCISSVLSRSPKAPHDQTNHQKCSLGLLFTCSTSYTISTPDLQTTTFVNRNRFLWLWTLASYTDLRLHAWVAGRGGAIWKWYKIKWYKIKMARNITRLFLFHTVMEKSQPPTLKW